ncbi:MAG: hypothetical protein QXD51_03875 [Candidatus Anstonellales archaeon]
MRGLGFVGAAIFGSILLSEPTRAQDLYSLSSLNVQDTFDLNLNRFKELMEMPDLPHDFDKDMKIMSPMVEIKPPPPVELRRYLRSGHTLKWMKFIFGIPSPNEKPAVEPFSLKDPPKIKVKYMNRDCPDTLTVREINILQMYLTEEGLKSAKLTDDGKRIIFITDCVKRTEEGVEFRFGIDTLNYPTFYTARIVNDHFFYVSEEGDMDIVKTENPPPILIGNAMIEFYIIPCRVGMVVTSHDPLWSRSRKYGDWVYYDFEDYTDFDFNDVMIRASTRDSMLYVENQGFETACSDRNALYMVAYSTDKRPVTLTLLETGETFTGENLRVRLWKALDESRPTYTFLIGGEKTPKIEEAEKKREIMRKYVSSLPTEECQFITLSWYTGTEWKYLPFFFTDSMYAQIMQSMISYIAMGLRENSLEKLFKKQIELTDNGLKILESEELITLITNGETKDFRIAANAEVSGYAGGLILERKDNNLSFVLVYSNDGVLFLPLANKQYLEILLSSLSPSERQDLESYMRYSNTDFERLFPAR